MGLDILDPALLEAEVDETLTSEEPTQAPLSPKDEVRFNQMVRAMESENGIRLRCKDATQAQAIRFRLYRTRRRIQARGITALDDILLKIEDTSVLILPPPEYDVTEELI